MYRSGGPGRAPGRRPSASSPADRRCGWLPFTRSSTNPFFSRILITFCAVNAGSSGMCLDGEGVFQEPFLGGNLLALLLEMFNVELDSLPCHRYCLVNSLPIGDAPAKARHGDGIPAFWLSSVEDAVAQALHRTASLRATYTTRPLDDVQRTSVRASSYRWKARS